MDPDDAENAAEIERVLGILRGGILTPFCPLCSEPPVMQIGDIALCGNEECKTVFWVMTKSMDELMANMGLVDLRNAVVKGSTGSGWDVPHEDTPES
jgi:hypothetical protein